ncbi:hypothetical protein B0T19DRAFT_442012 [Cercophora scortea]|uniref:Uncharacterized protein n=1 Tax=Cercophora scortea TaxID=314031 RepID=A0AAE0IN83_9PEZI|nr:hypothetical protein B0T19DRAFT_442012 [Cercophora scortea]
MTHRGTGKAQRRAGKLKHRLAAADTSHTASETALTTATGTEPEITRTATISSPTQSYDDSRIPEILVDESTTSIVLSDGREFTLQAPGNEPQPTTLPPPHPVSSVPWSPEDTRQEDDPVQFYHFGSPTRHNPSPWYNLDNLVPMASRMPQETAAALAVTSKAMYSIIGPKAFQNMERGALWRLLLLLERDSDFAVACGYCLRLHSPFSQPGDDFHGLPDCSNIDASVRFVVAPAMCRLLAKRYIQRQPYGTLITAAVRTAKCILPDFKSFASRDMRFVDGNLLLRTQSFIAPLDNNANRAPEGGLDLRGLGAFFAASVFEHSIEPPRKP